MDLISNWKQVKNLFKESFKTSFHFAVASVTENGEPHVTPIGSLILGEPGRGIYFEEFPRHLPRNLERNKKVCILAVNSSKWFWLKSLLKGQFKNPPAVRLHGVVGDLRQASDLEIALWQRRVKSVSFTRGHKIMWKKMATVRDIEFNKIEPVDIGEMTLGAWKI